MIPLTAGFEIAAFWKGLANAGSRVLMLDYDGTLAPFRVERARAGPYDGVREILNEIMQLRKCRVVIVSGRTIKDLIPLLRLQRQPEIWGAHGVERLFPGGRYESVSLGGRVIAGLDRAMGVARREGFEERCERKPGAVALHWRGLDACESGKLRKKAADAWADVAEDAGLVLREFDGGIELRATVRNKGDAVNTILSEEGGNTVAAYLGDDLTDEDAFRAIKRKGIGVLVRNELRDTHADLWIKPPVELLEFLTDWAGACESG